VELVYRNVLGRPGDPSGVTYWTGQLDAGKKGRGQVMIGFSESAEYQRQRRARSTRRSCTSCSSVERRRRPSSPPPSPRATEVAPWAALVELIMAQPAYAARAT